MHWQLNRVMYPVENLGPGKRIAIWVQGCSLICEGCINPDLWEKFGGRRVDMEGFAAGIIRLAQSLDGISITGGEPFDQYPELVAFCSFVKQKTNLEVLVFSGYTLEQLFTKFPDRLFTRCIDFLVDGPYLKSLPDQGRLRGSKNQMMYTFQLNSTEMVDTKRVEVPDVNSTWSFGFNNKNSIIMSGIPGIDDPEMLNEKMKRSGIDFEL